MFALEPVPHTSNTWSRQKYHVISSEGIKYGPWQYPLFEMCRALLHEGTAMPGDIVQVGHTSCLAGRGAAKRLTEGSKTSLQIVEYKEEFEEVDVHG